MAYQLQRTWQHAWNTNGTIGVNTYQAFVGGFLAFVGNLMTGTQAVTNAAGGAIGSPAGTWPVLGSSNSTTGALDGVNRCTVYTSWVPAASNGTAHSWLTLGPGPNGGYLTLDYTGNVGGFFVSFVHSKTAPTGGNNANRPTATDETASSAMQITTGDSASQLTYHGILSTTGDCWAGANINGNGNCLFSLGWFYLGNPKASDQTPWILNVDGYLSVANTNIGAPNVIGPCSLTTLANSVTIMRPPDNTGAQGTSIKGVALIPGYVSPGTTGFFYNGFAATGDPQDSSYAGWPIPIVSLSTSGGTAYTLRGQLVDIQIAAAANLIGQNGKVEPAVGTPDAVIMGHFWLPCNVASVTL